MWVCGVSVSRVCVVCYSTHHRVMSQARGNFEGFLKAHMSEEEKVIVQVETSLSGVEMSGPYLSTLPSLTHSRTHALSHPRTHSLNQSLTHPYLSTITQLPAEKVE